MPEPPSPSPHAPPQPRLCGAVRPVERNNPRPCARAEHCEGDHVDRQGVAWTGHTSGDQVASSLRD